MVPLQRSHETLNLLSFIQQKKFFCYEIQLSFQFILVLYFVGGGVGSGHTQQCSVINFCFSQSTICSARAQTGIGCIQGKCHNPCTISSVLPFLFEQHSFLSFLAYRRPTAQYYLFSHFCQKNPSGIFCGSNSGLSIIFLWSLCLSCQFDGILITAVIQRDLIFKKVMTFYLILLKMYNFSRQFFSPNILLNNICYICKCLAEFSQKLYEHIFFFTQGRIDRFYQVYSFGYLGSLIFFSFHVLVYTGFSNFPLKHLIFVSDCTQYYSNNLVFLCLLPVSENIFGFCTITLYPAMLLSSIISSQHMFYRFL